MNADEKRWQAENDADALARYEEIMGNASRRTAAVKVAKERAADLTKRAGIMQKVAKTSSSSTKSVKRGK